MALGQSPVAEMQKLIDQAYTKDGLKAFNLILGLRSSMTYALYKEMVLNRENDFSTHCMIHWFLLNIGEKTSPIRHEDIERYGREFDNLHNFTLSFLISRVLPAFSEETQDLLQPNDAPSSSRADLLRKRIQDGTFDEMARSAWCDNRLYHESLRAGLRALFRHNHLAIVARKLAQTLKQLMVAQRHLRLLARQWDSAKLELENTQLDSEGRSECLVELFALHFPMQRWATTAAKCKRTVRRLTGKLEYAESRICDPTSNKTRHNVNSRVYGCQKQRDSFIPPNLGQDTTQAKRDVQVLKQYGSTCKQQAQQLQAALDIVVEYVPDKEAVMDEWQGAMTAERRRAIWAAAIKATLAGADMDTITRHYVKLADLLRIADAELNSASRTRGDTSMESELEAWWPLPYAEAGPEPQSSEAKSSTPVEGRTLGSEWSKGRYDRFGRDEVGVEALCLEKGDWWEFDLEGLDDVEHPDLEALDLPGLDFFLYDYYQEESRRV